jgi:hypothetical protein
MTDRIDPRRPNQQGPETPDDDIPETWDDAPQPEDPTEEPGYEEEYDQPPPADAPIEPRR